MPLNEHPDLFKKNCENYNRGDFVPQLLCFYSLSHHMSWMKYYFIYFIQKVRGIYEQPNRQNKCSLSKFLQKFN